MEKLLELANQFELEREKWIKSFKDNKLPLWKWYVDAFWDLCYESNKNFNWEDCYWDTAMAVLISKHYWFIEWLVKEDKIDLDKINLVWELKDTWEDDSVNLSVHAWSDSTIMILSISKNPIEALLCILK